MRGARSHTPSRPLARNRGFCPTPFEARRPSSPSRQSPLERKALPLWRRATAAVTLVCYLVTLFASSGAFAMFDGVGNEILEPRRTLETVPSSYQRWRYTTKSQGRDHTLRFAFDPRDVENTLQAHGSFFDLPEQRRSYQIFPSPHGVSFLKRGTTGTAQSFSGFQVTAEGDVKIGSLPLSGSFSFKGGASQKVEILPKAQLRAKKLVFKGGHIQVGQDAQVRAESLRIGSKKASKDASKLPVTHQFQIDANASLQATKEMTLRVASPWETGSCDRSLQTSCNAGKIFSHGTLLWDVPDSESLNTGALWAASLTLGARTSLKTSGEVLAHHLHLQQGASVINAKSLRVDGPCTGEVRSKITNEGHFRAHSLEEGGLTFLNEGRAVLGSLTGEGLSSPQKALSAEEALTILEHEKDTFGDYGTIKGIKALIDARDSFKKVRRSRLEDFFSPRLRFGWGSPSLKAHLVTVVENGQKTQEAPLEELTAYLLVDNKIYSLPMERYFFVLWTDPSLFRLPSQEGSFPPCPARSFTVAYGGKIAFLIEGQISSDGYIKIDEDPTVTALVRPQESSPYPPETLASPHEEAPSGLSGMLKTFFEFEQLTSPVKGVQRPAWPSLGSPGPLQPLEKHPAHVQAPKHELHIDVPATGPLPWQQKLFDDLNAQKAEFLQARQEGTLATQQELDRALARLPVVHENILHDTHTSYSHKTTTLGTGLKAVLGAGLSLATAGAFAPLAASVEATTGSVFLGGAAQATAASAVSDLAVNTLQHGGNVGKALEDTFSGDGLKTLGASAVTGGLTAKLGQAVDLPKAPRGLDLVKQKAIKATVNTGVATTVLGQDLQDAFKRSLRNFAADTVQGLAATEIGDATKGRPLTTEEVCSKNLDPRTLRVTEGGKLYQAPTLPEGMSVPLHFGSGALRGVIEKADNPLIPGLTSVAGELAVEGAAKVGWLDPADSAFKEKVQAFGNLAATGVSLACGIGPQDRDFSLAQHAATTTVEKNFIPHLMAAGYGVLTLWEAYEIIETYHQEGLAAAGQKLLIDGTISVATGGVFKVAGKAYPTLERAAKAALEKTPLLSKLAHQTKTALQEGKIYLTSLADKTGQKITHTAEKTLFKPGKSYHPSYIDKQRKGLKAEQRAASVFERLEYTSLDCRLPGNKGLDGVFVKYRHDGSVGDIIVCESKFATKGRARLSKNTREIQQMSDPWINRQIDLMLQSKNPTLEKTANLLNSNKDLIRRKANVLDGQGRNRWNKLNLPKTDKFKE